MRPLNTSIMDELDDALRRVAERQDRPISRVVRSALEEYLSRYDDEGSIGDYVRTVRVEPVESPVPEKEPANG
jgi:hypothetical protein